MRPWITFVIPRMADEYTRNALLTEGQRLIIVVFDRSEEHFGSKMFLPMTNKAELVKWNFMLPKPPFSGLFCLRKAGRHNTYLHVAR